MFGLRFFQKRPTDAEIQRQIDLLQARLSAIEVAQSEFDKVIEDAVDAEVQRHIDDMDIDSIVSEDVLADRIAEVLRDELRDSTFSIKVK